MILFLDTETTGLYPGNICQLSYIMQDKCNTVAKNFFFTVNYVEPSAQAVHGLSVEALYFLSNGKKFIDCIDEIELDFNKANVIITHNTSFDFMFLRKEFEKCGKVFAPHNEFCSMKKSVPICKLQRANHIGYKYPKVCELCSHFYLTDVEITKKSNQLFGDSKYFHDARFDTTSIFMCINIGFEEGFYKELKEQL